MSVTNQDAEKLRVAKAAVAYVKNNDIVGLGTGSTATLAIRELAKLINDGLRITGVASSEATQALAISLGIPMLPLGSVKSIDISIDGADEFTEKFELIKGGGGALFREKVMASLSKKCIIITDASKLVNKLGAFSVPIEVNPNAEGYIVQALEKLNAKPVKRFLNGNVFITDNQNYIFDTDFGLIKDPTELSASLNQLVGVLAHGIFVGLTSIILMAKSEEIIIFENE